MTNQIATELQKLAKKNHGTLLPEAVVDAARVVTSPLHSCFEWDDTEAAKAHRLWQARQLIVNVVVKYEGVKNTAPMFVSLKKDRQAGVGYRAMVDVLSDSDLTAQLLEDARADMKVFQRKYRQLTELAGVFAAMEKV